MEEFQMKRQFLIATLVLTSSGAIFATSAPAQAGFLDWLKGKAESSLQTNVERIFNNTNDTVQHQIDCSFGKCQPTPTQTKQNLIQQLLKTKQCISCDLSQANLRNADLRNARLEGANLSGADLNGANLSGAYLRNSNLSQADLSKSDLSNAYLKHANLTNADLHLADLSRADLSRAILTGADLTTATVNGTSFRNAIMPTAQPPKEVAEQ
jgi:uncharacterized protein YjbI with pentapeptide repeats